MHADGSLDDDRIAQLFEEARQLSPAPRREFLERECGDDGALLAELHSLLASHDSAPDYLERLGPRVLPQAFEALGENLDPAGEVIGRYEVLERSGSGGMGEVFRARDLELGREVALKFLPAHLAADDAAVRRLRREARIASALDHPGIAVVHEIGAAPGGPGEPARTFIAMAWCGDRSLADELREQGPRPVGRALDCLIQLVDALSSAHDAGVVHRDVKPANLIVGDGGTLKLVDFGLATRERASAGGGGTLAYMSPEQLAGGPVDHRCDIWAAGVVLYELLSGARPFYGADARAVAESIRCADPAPLEELRADVPPRLMTLVRRCLAKAPADRHSSATALLTDLRTVLDTGFENGGGVEGSPSLVVLPFAGEEDPSTSFLVDGFAEEIIADLSRVRGLRVIAGSSSRRLRESRDRVDAIAAELGVRHVLEGSIQMEGTTLRVSAALLDTRSGRRSWSATLEAGREDLLRVRREVTRSVVAGLGLPPTALEQPRLSAASEDPRAYEAHLRARHEAWSFTAGGLARARRHIEAALVLVGESELLLGTLGHITALHADSGQFGPGLEAEVEELSARVFGLDPRSARGHWLCAWSAFHRGDLRNAIRSGERAHALATDDPDVLLLLGYIYLNAGRNADGRALLERALLLDPLTPLTQGVQGFLPVLEGRADEAVEPYRRASGMDPASPFFPTFHGWALAHAGRIDEAVVVLGNVATRFPGTVFASLCRCLALGLQGRGEEALAAISPDLEAAARGSGMFARELAHGHALAGATRTGLDWLERAVDLGLWNHAYLAEHDRLLDALRGEPRFVSLLERVRRIAATV